MVEKKTEKLTYNKRLRAIAVAVNKRLCQTLKSSYKSVQFIVL